MMSYNNKATKHPLLLSALQLYPVQYPTMDLLRTLEIYQCTSQAKTCVLFNLLKIMLKLLRMACYCYNLTFCSTQLKY